MPRRLLSILSSWVLCKIGYVTPMLMASQLSETWLADVDYTWL